ncbi:MAG TPA: hypothetical protein PKL08_07900, partial [Thermoanaerobaculaceae bacterium]|nr:hypothetical protein [Thermoanaerobaculaceae bacterium]
LEIELMHAVAGLAIKIDLAPPAGAVVSVRIDDLPRELQLATAGAVVEIRKALQPGIHIIEVSTVTTGRATPGDVRAIP